MGPSAIVQSDDQKAVVAHKRRLLELQVDSAKNKKKAETASLTAELAVAYQDAVAELALFEGGVFEADSFLHQVKKARVDKIKTELAGMLDIVL